MNFGIISKSEIMQITRNLLAKVYEFISLDNKKNEVDELTETVAILYKKDLYEDDDGDDYEQISGYTINEVIVKIANSKVSPSQTVVPRFPVSDGHSLVMTRFRAGIQ